MGECEGVHIEGALSAKITRSSLCYSFKNTNTVIPSDKTDLIINAAKNESSCVVGL